MACVNGMFFGHAFTQFWTKPHSWMPPGPVSAVRRSCAFIFPVGCAFNKRTWPITAAPTNPVASGMYCYGQTSKQLPHEMQCEKGIRLFLRTLRHARADAQVVAAVDRNPRLHALQIVEQALTVHLQVAHYGEFASAAPELDLAAPSDRINAVHAWRDFPFTSIVQAPQTSSRQFAS